MSARVQIVQRVQNYAETAGLARELSCRYGQVYGKLVDAKTLVGPQKSESPLVRAVLAEFESIKKSKDSNRIG